MAIQTKAVGQYFPVALFIVVYKVVLTCESVDETLSESYTSISHFGAVYVSGFYRGKFHNSVLWLHNSPFILIKLTFKVQLSSDEQLNSENGNSQLLAIYFALRSFKFTGNIWTRFFAEYKVQLRKNRNHGCCSTLGDNVLIISFLFYSFQPIYEETVFIRAHCRIVVCEDGEG